MLTLTDDAQTAVRTLTQDPDTPENAGLRITPGNEGLELMFVTEPVPGDALIEGGGARVFVEPQTAQSPMYIASRRPESADIAGIVYG